ncbi:thioredoxin family protein [Thiomicrorhabdus sp.]|uniref:thioredoxin family protein n=1 Tax=Thiomicrorhabdus sp. TaxID=2039724 RepID=UPI0029C62000|nr:thioredoxin family protein [Thiomicrorhabdus sp.]
MKILSSLQELDQMKMQSEALLVLFGGTECNVCHVVKPKLQALIGERYPKMQQVYIDCHQTTEICAQNGIFSLPVVQVFFGGQKFIEEVRSFSVGKLADEIARPYSMMFNEV